jgi:myo-inositol catabolism protein IolC
MRRQCARKSVVEVTSSSVYTGQATYQPKNIFDAQNATEFLLNLVADQWVRVDLKDKRVIANKYVIKACQANVGLNPKSWKLEGKIDGGQWEVLDRQDNSTDLAGAGVVKAWMIEKEVECR